MAETPYLKHVGRLKNTGDRVVVVFRELVDEDGAYDSDHALVIYPDRLHDRYHDRIMDLLESDRAQDSDNFYEVLNSKKFHDGNNMLTFLHQRGHLKRVPVDNVTLCPTAQERQPLRQFNQQISQNKPESANKLNEYAEQEIPRRSDQQQARQPNENYHVRSGDVTTTPSQQDAQNDDSPEAQAKALLAQAHIMEQERDMMNRTINEKRDKAYELDPSLKPAEKTSRTEADEE